MEKWEVNANNQTYMFTFLGINAEGKARIRINDQEGTYPSLVVENVGTYYYLPFYEKELILKGGPEGFITDVNIDGTYLLSHQPLERRVAKAYQKAHHFQRPPSRRNIDGGLRSYLSFVIFTFVNIILFLINSPWYFPFSAVVPQLTVEFGWSYYYMTNMSGILYIGIAIGVIFAGLYLLLYFLAKSKDWAFLVAFILVCIDTIVILYFAIFDFAYYIIDIAFHGLIIYQMAKVIRERIRIRQRQ